MARGKGSGTVYWNEGRGRWVVQWTVKTVGGSKRRTKYFQDEDVARLFADQVSEQADGAAEDPLLADYLGVWLRDVVEGSVRLRTLQRYESICRVHLSPALGHFRLGQIKPQLVAGMLAAKRAESLSPRSVRYIHQTLHHALENARAWGLLTVNPVSNIKAPKQDRPRVRYWTPDHARAFLRLAGSDRYEAAYWLALTAGLRQGEIFGLRWEDVELDKGLVRVRQTLITDNKGRRSFGEPKTYGGRRTVLLIPPTLAVMAKQGRRSGLVFTTQAGTPMQQSNFMSRNYRPLVERCQLPYIRFHDLRHTCATLLLAEGVHARVVQEMLGHSSVGITLNTYSHVLPSLHGSARDAMAGLFEG